jgi:flagellar biosynthesis protein FlhG
VNNNGPESPSSRESVRGARHVIAVGGGRGGVGKSLIAGSLAIYFAQLGKSVVLADGDITGGNLHAHFGLGAAKREPSLERTALTAIEDALVSTMVPGLSLLAAAHDSIDPVTMQRTGRKGRWLGRLRALPADYVVIDVGPGHGAFQLDVLAAADMAIVVAVPEPPAIEATYRFMRASFLRRLRRSVHRDKLRSALIERALRESSTLPAPIELVRSLSKMDRLLAEAAWAEARRLPHYLVVNQTRVRSDLEVGNWMSALCARHYGVPLEELGHVEQDDTVWLSVRRNRPLLVDSPASKAARNVERIARRVLAMLTTVESRAAAPAPLNLGTPSLYDVLSVSRAATDEDIRRAFKKQREIYGPGGLATSSLLTETQLKAELARVDEAHDTLLDPVRRRAHDLSMFPDAADEPKPSVRPARPALAAEQLMLQAELAREIGPDTEFTGALMRKVRESQGIDLAEIAGHTKISRVHLAAIEEEDFTSLPATVYVRGFVTELAKFLRLDAAQVMRSYLRRMRERATDGDRG